MKIYSTSWEPFYSANLNLWKNIYEIENIVIGQIHLTYRSSRNEYSLPSS